MHRQEELEHLELERALTLSMAVEEERLRLMMADAKMAEFEAEYNALAAEASSAYERQALEDNETYHSSRRADAKVSALASKC